MASKGNQVQLQFRSHIKFTEFSALVLSYIRNDLKMDEDNAFKVEIALREVVNNAVIHGNQNDPEKMVRVSFRWTRSKLIIIVEDEGGSTVNFDAIQARLEQNDLLSFSGRGIMITQSYMDRVSFESTSRGSRITMEKKL